jgi:DsbC/DsbD-like thiol-disulfide interchange protein
LNARVFRAGNCCTAAIFAFDLTRTRLCDFAQPDEGGYCEGMTHSVFKSIALIAFLPLSAGATFAQDAPDGVLTAEILSGWAEADGARMVALKIGLADGWKTYWRAPGDAGIPPHFDFSASENVASVEVQWPRPEVFESAGVRTIGYHHEVILPLKVVPQVAGDKMYLVAGIDMGICEEICVPVQVNLSAELDGQGAPDAKISAAMQAVPQLRNGSALCLAEPIADGMRVTARIDAAQNTPQETEEVALFELIDKPVWISESQSHREGDVLVSSAEFVPDAGKPFEINLDAVRLTVLRGDEAFEVMGCAG